MFWLFLFVGPVRGSAAMVSQAENWKLLQTIGDKPVGTLVDGDVVSAVEFDEQVYQTLNPKPMSGIIGDKPVGTRVEVLLMVMLFPLSRSTNRDMHT